MIGAGCHVILAGSSQRGIIMKAYRIIHWLGALLLMWVALCPGADPIRPEQANWQRLYKTGLEKAVGFKRVNFYARVAESGSPTAHLHLLIVPEPGPIQGLRAHVAMGERRISETFELTNALFDNAAELRIPINLTAEDARKALKKYEIPNNPFADQKEGSNSLQVVIESVQSKG